MAEIVITDAALRTLIEEAQQGRMLKKFLRSKLEENNYGLSHAQLQDLCKLFCEEVIPARPPLADV